MTVVDNERRDGVSPLSEAFTSIWYYIHTSILPFWLQLTLKSTLPPSDASPLDSVSGTGFREDC